MIREDISPGNIHLFTLKGNSWNLKYKYYMQFY